MLVKCIANSPRQLGTPTLESFFSGETTFEEYLKVGTEYQVLGLAWSKSTLLTLVFDESRMPSFLPVGLFDFETASLLPARWEFKVEEPVAASGGAQPSINMAVWGYPELVRNPLHGEGLQLRDPDALKIFFRELQEENEAAGQDSWA